MAQTSQSPLVQMPVYLSKTIKPQVKWQIHFYHCVMNLTTGVDKVSTIQFMFVCQPSYSLVCMAKLCLDQSKDVSCLLSSVIHGKHCQTERHTGRTMSILNGLYYYKSPVVLLDKRKGLDTVKVNLYTFVQISVLIFEGRPLQGGSETWTVLKMGFILIIGYICKAEQRGPTTCKRLGVYIFSNI